MAQSQSTLNKRRNEQDRYRAGMLTCPLDFEPRTFITSKENQFVYLIIQLHNCSRLKFFYNLPTVMSTKEKLRKHYKG